MAASTEPRGGLLHTWTPGENGWDVGMNANLLKLSRVALGGGVADRDLTAPPGSPTAGDAYIVGPSATGDWDTEDDSIAVYDGTDWVFYAPANGMGIYILDEDVWAVYKTGSGWSDGVGHTWT